MARARKRLATASAKKPARGQRPGWHSWLRLAVVTVMCVITAALFSPFNRLLPAVMVPIVVGLCAGVWTRRPGWAAGIGAVASLAGCSSVLSVFGEPNFADWIQTRMPPYTVQDTTRAVFDFIRETIAVHPLTVARSNGQAVALVVVLAALTAGIAATVAWWRSKGSSGSRTVIAAWTAAGLLAVCFAYTAWTGTVAFRASISSEPADLSYAYDPVFNVKTYHMMRRGVGFYDAYVYSITKDSRRAGSGESVGGKLASGSPIMLRQPAAFHLWRVAGAGGVDGIIVLSIAACMAILLASFAVLRKVASNRALFVAVMLYPGLMLHTVWLNIFFPDWWAALAILGSVLLLLGRRYWGAGVFAFLAIVFRETAGAWILVLIVGAIVLWLRGQREWRAKAIGYGVGLLAAGGLFGLHYVAGKPYFVPAPPTAKPFSLVDLLAPNASKGLDWKLMSATSYLMQPYGLYAIPTLFMLPAASAGFWLSLPKKSLERFALTVYPTMLLLYFLTVGATSQYWGQLVMPIGIIGTGLLLARADLTVAELVGRKPLSASDLD